MTKRLFKYACRATHTCSCNRCDGEPVVREGLAMSPSDVAAMTARGMPVNQKNLSLFQDGEPNPSPYVTSERRRGVDVAELWEEHQRILKKARSAARKSNSKTE